MLIVCMLMLTPAISCLYFQYDCDGIASLLCKGLVQACILCIGCIGDYVALCTVSVVISLLLIATNGLWSVIALTSLAKQ